jgi:hypothetical protein
MVVVINGLPPVVLSNSKALKFHEKSWQGGKGTR